MKDFLLRTLARLEARRDARLAADGAAVAPDAFVARGEALEAGGDLEGALAAYREGISRRPDSALLQVCAGNMLRALGRTAEAAAHYRQAIELDPDYPAARLNLGTACLQLGQSDEAEASYRVALRLRPGWVEAWVGLGCALEDSDTDAALVAYREALARDPAHAGAAFNAATRLADRGELEAAAAMLQEALAQTPGHAALLRARADVLRRAGRAAEALALYDQVLAADPGDADAASNRLFTLTLLPDQSAEALLREHRAWAERFTRGVAPLPAPGPRPPGRLRIGYVSPDFRQHPVALFIAPVLRAHDRARVEVFCYSAHAREDAMTERLRGQADHWRSIAGVDDDAAAALIRDDGIDVLVDLAGHTGGNRLGVFARRPAPVQMTWLGYLSTTGLPAIAYRLCDARTDPPGRAEAWQTETPLRLPDSQWCYEPVLEVAPTPLPFLGRGHWTFGSFNQAIKLNPPLLAAWARLLAAVPGSRLRIAGLSDAAAMGEIRRAFERQGVEAARVAFAPRASIEAYFAGYGEVDLALDSFPYTGGTTTCDSLLAGVPVATVAGDRSVARSGVSLLGAVGLDDWIAPSLEALPDLVRAQLADPARLARLRAELGGRLKSSALMDADRFTRHLEALYRQAAAP